MIYLAGSCSSEERTVMMGIARTIRKQGFKVYCPWELKIENAWDLSQEEWAEQVFNADLAAIKECSCMILITEGRMSSAGKNWEHGFAFGIGKPVTVFQITDNPTSLMTYCSATYFYNCTSDTLFNQIVNFLQFLKLGLESKKWCKTVLT